MKFDLDTIHRVDSYQAIKELPDKSVDLIVTDPPYEITHLRGGGMLDEKGITNLMSELDDNNLYVGITDDIWEECLRVLKRPNIYIWCNKILIPKLIDFFVLKRKLTFDIICWHKTNAMPLCGSKYLTDTEYCLYFKDSVKLNTVYETAKTHYELPINISDKNKFEHPTIKPLKIIENLIFNSSNEGDIVFDPFIGSGTTAVASKNLKRHYLGFEISPKWHKIATDRLNNIQAGGQISLFTE